MSDDAPRNTRPNLVLFMPDQLRADALGAFGNPAAATPHLDAFAANGTIFTQTFAQHPVCSPSRASMFTGRYPHTLGHRTLTHLIQQGQDNVFKALKEQGYHVAWLAPRGDTYAVGATEESVDEYGFIVNPTHNMMASMQASTDAEPQRTWNRLFYGGRREELDCLDYDEAAIRSAEMWLEAPPEGPWVLVLPLIFPHCPFTVEEPWFSQHDRKSVPAPQPRKSGIEPSFMAGIREYYGIEHVDDAMWREIIATYYGMVSRIDDQFGRVQTALTQNGLAEDTVTMFFTDHGEYLGDYGLIEKWPAGLDDVLLRNPLIIGGADLPQGGRVDELVEMVDLVPTMLQLAGSAPEYIQFGRSLLPLIANNSATHREYAFSEGGFRLEEESQLERAGYPYDRKADLQHEDTRLVGRAFSARSRRWAYIYRLYESHELYDREADPYELVNLIDSPAHADVVDQMRGALLDWMAATSDVIPRHEDDRSPAVALVSPREQYERRLETRVAAPAS